MRLIIVIRNHEREEREVKGVGVQVGMVLEKVRLSSTASKHVSCIGDNDS